MLDYGGGDGGGDGDGDGDSTFTTRIKKGAHIKKQTQNTQTPKHDNKTHRNQKNNNKETTNNIYNISRRNNNTKKSPTSWRKTRPPYLGGKRIE